MSHQLASNERRSKSCPSRPFPTASGIVHMLHQCAICTMMPHAHSGTVQSLSHRDVLQRPRASALHIVTTSNERISVVIESLEVLAGTADTRDVTEALTWAKTNRDTLRRLWREYSE